MNNLKNIFLLSIAKSLCFFYLNFFIQKKINLIIFLFNLPFFLLSIIAIKKK